MKGTHKEGELYRRLTLFGKSFELRFGYYEECDRENPLVEPVPIYRDFLLYPEYTDEGHPFVTKMQDACGGYRGEASSYPECGDCEHYCHGAELMGICLLGENRVVPDRE